MKESDNREKSTRALIKRLEKQVAHMDNKIKVYDQKVSVLEDTQARYIVQANAIAKAMDKFVELATHIMEQEFSRNPPTAAPAEPGKEGRPGYLQ